MQYRSIDGECRPHVEHAGKFFVVNDHSGRCGFGGSSRFRRNGDDAVSSETHDVVGENGPIEQHAAEMRAADVDGGEHGSHARNRFRRAHIDALDPRVGKGALGERRPERVARDEVCGVLHASRDFRPAVDANLRHRKNAASVGRRDHICGHRQLCAALGLRLSVEDQLRSGKCVESNVTRERIDDRLHQLRVDPFPVVTAG